MIKKRIQKATNEWNERTILELYDDSIIGMEQCVEVMVGTLKRQTWDINMMIC